MGRPATERRGTPEKRSEMQSRKSGKPLPDGLQTARQSAPPGPACLDIFRRGVVK